MGRSIGQPLGAFYDDDLLTAALTRRSPVWRSNPQWAADLKEIISLLEDISPNIRKDVQKFFLEAGARAKN
ncbi:hypothetical protein [Streptomyces sp. NPDC102283]|uniref:hypothetical protein n=1 Tax=Streptomyces sp. NPDC102283 TaxID=3366155 RepID=UPI0038095969